MAASDCSVCKRPVANVRSGHQNACPFCQRRFGRVDVARRHAKTCHARGNRPLPPGSQRGRKLRACDACSRVKVSCDSGLPCARCSSRGFACTYRWLCHDPSHRRGSPPAGREAEMTRDNRLALSFLLHATDPNPDSMVHIVTEESERDCEAPVAWKRQEASSTRSPEETIDPRFLLLDFSDMLLNNPRDGDLVFEDCARDSFGLDPPAASTDNLASRVSVLESNIRALVASKPHLGDGFEQSCTRGFFTSAHFRSCLTAYYRRRHCHLTSIHWHTLDPSKIKLELLLGVVLVGTIYLQYLGSASRDILDPSLLELSEKYIFKELKRWADSDPGLPSSTQDLEVFQAALLAIAMQSSANDVQARRRVMSKRNPVIVATLRRFGVIGGGHDTPLRETTWSEFIYQETCARLVAWTFSHDSMLTLFFNSPPVITIGEMAGRLPCAEELWDAESEAVFETRRARPGMQCVLSIREAISGLLGDVWTESIIARYDGLGIPNLYHLISALQTVIYNHHTAMLPASSSAAVLRAVDRWSSLWADAIDKIPADELKWLGISRNAYEGVLLCRRMIEVNGTEEAKESGYLQRTVQYDTTDFHEFIRKYGWEERKSYCKDIKGIN